MPLVATLQDVAERAGVHRSTVSLALRNSPRISAEVRERVRAIANELGYRSNPLVSALMRTRRRPRTRQDGNYVVLAYVTSHPPAQHSAFAHLYRPGYYLGASARAEQLGFKLEPFYLDDVGMTAERISRILTSRGIRGLLLANPPPHAPQPNIEWHNFSAVTLGAAHPRLGLHRVAEDAFAAASEALHQCLLRGYRRLGLVLTDVDVELPYMIDRWRGAFLRLQETLPEAHRVPICAPDRHTGYPAQFREWLSRHAPDAILTPSLGAFTRAIAPPRQCLPARMELFVLDNDQPELGHAGMCIIQQNIGEVGVDVLVSLLHRGETGLPAVPHHVLLPGKWIDGPNSPCHPPRYAARGVAT